MKLGSHGHVRNAPEDCARWLTTSGVVPAVEVTVALHTDTLTVLHARFDSPPPEHLPGYPEEHVRVTISEWGTVLAVPVNGDQRRWLHRNPRCRDVPVYRVPWEALFGSLCLEYPRDPQHLRWRWADGIDAYLRIAQRHLWAEEYWRRHGRWPAEDTPHGERPDGLRHPIVTPELMSA